jgi:serine/threonine protein kinase/Tol biopolymer transport system component
MQHEPRNLISELYHRASALPPKERGRFLKDACAGDDALRQEIESLLTYEAVSSGFLERPAGNVAEALMTGPRTSMIGRQLGPYTIVAPLGAGGMGEVYRARDLTLDRDVAIKILPSHFTDDPERRLWFAREARVLATLNHPHIGAIYGLQELEGTTALILELVEGPTLAERLDQGPLPISDILPIARQIASALEAAHEKGIIHRDLKPANIVLQDGRAAGMSRRTSWAKILDFGLAKATATIHEAPPGQRPTGPPPSAADGRVLGTPAYMSPEQARGRPVDKRTDVWAFGCVLYEMLTARPPFLGDTTADTIVAVLEREPDWSAVPAETPDRLRTLMRRCMEKDPARRLSDFGEARLELEQLPAAGSSTPPWWRWRVPRAPRSVALAGLGLVGLGIVLWLTFGSPAPDQVVQVTRLTFDDGLQTDPALSADGQFFAYAANRSGNFDLYTRSVAGGNPVQVTNHPAHDWQPDWSINSELVFRSERDGGGLYVVGPTGGQERRVVSFGDRPLWSPDGTRILFGRYPSLRLYTVGPNGGEPRTCDQCSGGNYGWFGDANHVADLSTGPEPQHQPQFRVIAVDSGDVQWWTIRPAVARAFRELGLGIRRSTLAWDSERRARYFSATSAGASAVWSLELDPGSRSVTGGPHRLAAIAEDTGGVTMARATGALAFAAAARNPRLSWYPLDPSGRRLSGPAERVTSGDLPPTDVDVAPDGSRFVFSVRRPVGPATELRTKLRTEQVERPLRVTDTARGERRQRPRLSADGRRVVFRYVTPDAPGSRADQSWVDRPQQLRLLEIDSAEESNLTALSSRLVLPGGFSEDGRFVLASLGAVSSRSAPGMSIALLPLAAAPAADLQMRVVTTRLGGAGLLQPAMSPDGRWIAFEVQDDGARIALVRSIDGLWSEAQDERSWRYLDPIAMYAPRWSVDGRLLYFTSTHGGLANVWAVDFEPASGTVGRPFQVTAFTGEDARVSLTVAMTGVARGGILLHTVDPRGGIWLAHRPR